MGLEVLSHAEKGGGRREEGTSPSAPRSLLSLVEAKWPEPLCQHKATLETRLAGGGERRGGEGCRRLRQRSCLLAYWLPTFPSGQPGRCKAESTSCKNESASFPLQNPLRGLLCSPSLLASVAKAGARKMTAALPRGEKSQSPWPGPSLGPYPGEQPRGPDAHLHPPLSAGSPARWGGSGSQPLAQLCRPCDLSPWDPLACPIEVTLPPSPQKPRPLTLIQNKPNKM